MLLAAALLLAGAHAACCGYNQYKPRGCTACPGYWYANCNNGSHTRTQNGCGFLGAGCQITCHDYCPQQDYGCGCGAGTGCQDCAGVPNGDAKLDECGVCNGDNTSCADCRGVPNGPAKVDECGVCEGDNSTCADCAGIPNGTTVVDECNVCGGTNACADCEGVPYGPAQVDECGVCDGDNSTCADCAGTPNGGAVVDDCGVCGGDNACISEHGTGCNDVWDRKMEYLDRHTVACPDGSALIWWALTANACTGNSRRVQYFCKTTPGTVGPQQVRDTACNHLRNQNLEFLDRQAPQCADGEVMQGWHLNADGCGGEDMRFRVWCRNLDNAYITGVVQRASGCNHMRGKELQYLDRHTLGCGNNAFITYWQVLGNDCGGDDMQVFYNCASTKDIVPEFGLDSGDCYGVGDTPAERSASCLGTMECARPGWDNFDFGCPDNHCCSMRPGGAGDTACYGKGETAGARDAACGEGLVCARDGYDDRDFGGCSGPGVAGPPFDEHCCTVHPGEKDCAGVYGGTSAPDGCGVCDGDNSTCDFENIGDSFCLGNGQSELDRKKFPDLSPNECRQRCLDNADGVHCWGYKATPNGKCWNYYDVITEVKGGELGDEADYHCHRKKDCNNSFGTGALLDVCGVCEGNGDTCFDECGVMGGDNSSCTDCNGDVNGNAVLDTCGVCNGDHTGCDITAWDQMERWCNASTANCKKCKGKDAVKNGNAYCKINRKKTKRCSRFKKDKDMCLRLSGCKYSEKTRKGGKVKSKCAGIMDLTETSE